MDFWQHTKRRFADLLGRVNMLVLEGLRRLLGSAVVQSCRDAVWILWTCRVPAASLAIGFALLSVPQSKDLFLDLSHETAGVEQLSTITRSMVASALWFGFVLTFGWALPVHLTARWAIDLRISLAQATPPEPFERTPLFGRLARYGPTGMGLLAYAIVLGAILAVRDQLFQPDLHTWSAIALNQTLAYLAALSIWAAIFLLLVWRDGMLARVAARRMAHMISLRFLSPESEPRAMHWIAQVLPFSFGALFFLWLYAVIHPEPSIVGRRVNLLPLILGAWLPVIHWLFTLSVRLRFSMIAVAAAALVTMDAMRGERHPVRFFALDQSRPSPDGHQPNRRQMVLYKAVAAWMAQQGPGCGDQAKLKRLLDSEKEPGKTSELTVAWSDLEALGDTGGCPRPVVVAAAGGASRAAFFTVSVLGHLLDISCRSPIANGTGPEARAGSCPERPVFADRLFAISGVSGGALGAGVYAAAWANAKAPDGSFRQPCARSGNAASRQWFGDEEITSWRACLQAIASGDFLSSVSLGLAFRDQLPFVANNQSDRAALLENAWEMSFAELMERESGLRLGNAFGDFMPKPGEWRPLLIMNGTSASTGRRLLTSHLAPFQTADYRRRLFPEALDLRELLFDSARREATDLTRRCRHIHPNVPLAAIRDDVWDVSLATAISNSARFPLISPPGTIGCAYPNRFNLGLNTDIFDKIIDGGYFENNGLATAFDLVQALEQPPFNLKPVVIAISNEPTTSEEWRLMFDASNQRPKKPDAPEVSYFDWLVTPLRGLYQTRTARGNDAFTRIDAALRRTDETPDPAMRNPKGRRLYHFAVFHEDDTGARPSSVSMSWWLSKPVQEYLDDQLPRLTEMDFDSDDAESMGRCINRNEFIRFCRRNGISGLCAPHLKLSRIGLDHASNGRVDHPWLDRCTLKLENRLD